MAGLFLNPFDQRQVMRRETFEIFHYNNDASCTCPPHQHDFFELYCLLSDETVDYVVEGLRYTLHPGDMILIPPGQIHRAHVPGPIRDIERFVLWMDQDYVKSVTATLPHARYSLLGELKGRSLIHPDPETGATMRELLGALHREDGQGGTDGAQLSRSILTQLLIYCGRCVAREPDTAVPRTEQRYREIMRVYEHILDHLNEDLSVAGLAELFFMDKNTLTRQFKRQVGMTPGECIRRHRLEAVRQRILTGLPAQEACAECGFTDYSAFYRAFRQAYGASPREYVARARGAETSANATAAK